MGMALKVFLEPNYWGFLITMFIDPLMVSGLPNLGHNFENCNNLAIYLSVVYIFDLDLSFLGLMSVVATYHSSTKCSMPARRCKGMIVIQGPLLSYRRYNWQFNASIPKMFLTISLSFSIFSKSPSQLSSFMYWHSSPSVQTTTNYLLISGSWEVLESHHNFRISSGKNVVLLVGSII